MLVLSTKSDCDSLSSEAETSFVAKSEVGEGYDDMNSVINDKEIESGE